MQLKKFIQFGKKIFVNIIKVLYSLFCINLIIAEIKKSLKTFSENLIDYAGLFPPAKLDLKEAFVNYLNYLDDTCNFMLSKFICPISQFPDLEKIIQQTSFKNFDILISALGRGGSTADIFKKNLSEDLAIWKNFNSGHTPDVKVLSLELKIPDDIITAHDSKVIAGFISNLSSEVKDKISQPVTIFIEGSLGDEWKDNSSALIDGIELHNQNSFDTGFKFRTGGVTADAFPDSGQISYCIRKCLDRKVPLKFTAGLHHPFPVFESEMAVTMHGFINVFAAGIIAMRHDISVREMNEILNDANPSNFIFTEDYFSWRDWKVEIDDIEFARKNLVLSFGSCSFDEPVDDLRSLHLL